MKGIIQKTIEKAKTILPKKKKWQLIASSPCSCKENCNKVLVLSQTDDTETIQIELDLRLDKQRTFEKPKFLSILVSRGFLMDNLLRSGKAMSKLAEFEYSLDRFFADMQSQNGTKAFKTPEEVTVQELKAWVKQELDKEYGKK